MVSAENVSGFGLSVFFHFGVSAVSAILAYFGHFGLIRLLLAISATFYSHVGPVQHEQDQKTDFVFGRNKAFRPKQSISAETSLSAKILFRPKFRLFEGDHFRFRPFGQKTVLFAHYSISIN